MTMNQQKGDGNCDQINRDIFTTSLLHNISGRQSNKGFCTLSPSDDLNLLILKNRNKTSISVLRERNENLELLNCYIPLAEIFQAIITSGKDRFFSSREVYRRISKLVKFEHDTIQFLTSGIITHFYERPSSCSSKCISSFILHTKERLDVGILLFVKNLSFTPKEVIGKRIFILNPIVLLSLDTGIKYEKTIASFSSPVLNIAFLINEDSQNSTYFPAATYTFSLCRKKNCIVPIFDKNSSYCQVHLTGSISEKMVRIRPELAAGHLSLLDPQSKPLSEALDRFNNCRKTLKELQFTFPFKPSPIILSIANPCIKAKCPSFRSKCKVSIEKKALIGEKEKAVLGILNTEPVSPVNGIIDEYSMALQQLTGISESESRKRSLIEEAMLRTKGAPHLGRNWANGIDE